MSLIVAQASADNESRMGCLFKSDVLGTDANKGAEVCTAVRRGIGELH